MGFIFDTSFMVLGISGLLLAVASLGALVVAARARYFIFVAFIIPLLLASVITFFGTVPHMLGKPFAGEIPEKSRYISHVMDDDLIYVTVIEPDSSKPRLYQIDRTDNNERRLTKSSHLSKNGIPQFIRRDANPMRQGEYTTYDFSQQQFEEKDDN